MTPAMHQFANVEELPRSPSVDSRPIHFDLSALERMIQCALLITIVVLRLVKMRSHPLDSDERQHLHVVWAWTHGMIQYRDTFDNHMPLFHLIMAPFVAFFGERPEILSF